MRDVRLGIIGGTGVDEIEGLTSKEKIEVATPFGAPSSRVVVGELMGGRVAFLPRHGDGHVLLPSEIHFLSL